MMNILISLKAQLMELGLGVIGIMSALLSFIPRNTWIGEKLDWLGSILGNLITWFKR